MTIKTRKPTGRAPWPLILIEGEEKSGKSWACAELSASEKVGQTYWLDLGEGAGDEYGAIPGARYEIIEHDGTWVSMFAQVEAVRDEARRAAEAGEPPVVLVIDTITAVWELLKDWATARARETDSAKKKLRVDPNAEIDVSMNLWNDANKRHRRLMTILMTFPGIAVVTARGKEVAALDDNGRPIRGTKDYRVEGQKGLAYDATVWVRTSREHAPMVVAARSVHVGIRPGVDKPKPMPEFSLEWVIFEALKCEPANAQVRELTEPKVDNALTPGEYRDKAIEPGASYDELRNLYDQVEKAGLSGTEVTNENGDEEPLGALIKRIGTERKGARQ